jgi:hypothetical protein
MVLLLYRSLPENQLLPVDQRWRTFEVDPEVFVDQDPDEPLSKAAIQMINDRRVPNVEPIPAGSTVYVYDTEAEDATAFHLQLSIRTA